MSAGFSQLSEEFWAGVAGLRIAPPLQAGEEVVGIYASLSRGLRGAMGASGFLVAGRRKSLVAGSALLLTSLVLAAMALRSTLPALVTEMLAVNAVLSLFSVTLSMLPTLDNTD